MNWVYMCAFIAGAIVLLILMYRMVVWAKKMPKGAFLFMALMPLIALFPIPPPQFKNIAKAKQEQRKKQRSEED